jgi:uncharacterized protein YdhG (YjbR/CyaY superfamily)
MSKPNNVDEYIAGFPVTVQEKLQQIRQTILKAAPHSQEIIGYSMPTYRQNSNLVYFAGWTNHVGFYPGASALIRFKDDLLEYSGAKGSVQFPYDKPIPLDIVHAIVTYRVQEDMELAERRKKQN